jgi:hypothetical protein
MTSKWQVLIAFLVAALFTPSGSWAQAGGTGALTGTVLDQGGGAIAGAAVVVTNVATGQKEREVVSTGAGTFNVPSLPPGTYSVEVTATGFSRFLIEKILVQNFLLGRVDTETRWEKRRRFVVVSGSEASAAVVLVTLSIRAA